MDTSKRPPRDLLGDIARRAMLARGLQPDFSQAAQREAGAITTAAAVDAPGIRDLRERLWCSIDNDDSRDLDQLSVAESRADGACVILVAIADVDALVVQDSAIDAHARTNTTSVYTAARIFPMLPEKLSTDMTSLGLGQDRLAIVVEMLIDAKGTLQRSDVYRGAVHNYAKLAYDSVAAWLEGTAPAPDALARIRGLDEQLRLQARVARALQQRRHERGALSLETGEARAVFAGEVLADLRSEQRNPAKEMIEDFMIAANGATAAFLRQAGFPTLRRVLRSPERWERIVELAQALGEQLPGAPDAGALAQFLARRRQADLRGFPDLSLSVVKLLGSGEYAAEFPGEAIEGHFGLAVRDYTHSTAPNRRFPDLITQRLLKAALGKRAPPYAAAELVELARHCTEQEDDATKVERQVRKSAAALLLEERVGERFEGIVTGAGPKGTWVRIVHPAAEGRIVEGFAGLDVGERVGVTLVFTDVERGYIDFVRARSAR